jgi:hypothetical protein
MKIKNLHIKEFKGLRDISINFEKNDEPLDLVVLAGSNGSGKTRILESILDYFQKIVNHIEHIENENVAGVFFETDEQSCLNEGYDLWSLYKILNSYNDENSFERGRKVVEKNLKVFPKIIYVPTETNFQKVEIASPMLFREYKFLNIVDSGLIKDVPSYIATRITELANEQESIPMGEIRKAVFREINEIFEILDLDIKISGISKNAKSIPIFTNSAGDKFDINELSSGEKQLFLRTLAIKMLNPENSIILIDEPELSLHPKWQQRIVDVYRKIGKNNQIIIATHSPHILGSVKKENIMLLDKDDEGKIVVRTGDELYDSYGQPTDRVLKDIMGLETTRNPKVFKLLEEAGELVDKNEYESEEFKTKYKKLREILGNKDEDLLLMDMDIQIRKKRGLKNVESK